MTSRDIIRREAAQRAWVHHGTLGRADVFKRRESRVVVDYDCLGRVYATTINGLRMPRQHGRRAVLEALK